MLRVLRHYLPLRRALLVFSETVILFAVLATGMTAHLWEPTYTVIGLITSESLTVGDAQVRCTISAFLVAVLAQIAIAFNELYDFRISSSRYDRASRFVGSTGSAVALALVTVLLARVWELSRVFDFPGLTVSQLVQALVFTLLFGFSLLYVWRHLFHVALRRVNFNERVLILGAGPQAKSLAREALERVDSGFEVVGLVPERPEEHPRGAARAVPEIPRFQRADPTPPTQSDSAILAEGALATLLLEPLPAPVPASSSNGNGHAHALEPLFDLVDRLRVDMVVVALEDRRGHLPTEELLRCRLAGIAVKEREALYEQITGKIAVEAMRPSYLIFNEGFARSERGELAKRACDLGLSALGIFLTWPLMLATAIVVKLDSPGFAMFSQERVGLNGKLFTLYKFRSMRSDAEKLTGPVWATENDPRITRSGRFIRKTRLDELPQLFNVLSGDMSLVGPRPERQVFVDNLARQIPYYHQRHIVKPGLTGWAQINYPYGNTVDDALQKLQYDLFYIKNQSLLFDLSILFQTIKTVVLRKGT
ncbi:MAG: TIGR03013 family PEP-CTERM/XrtA system glycosyltransferase [Planctomycetes bacterium]|nr:TIGR03013 family PEP-CTERM/XrtA system glycosyltransferase [Planctomycetota bacterium]